MSRGLGDVYKRQIMKKRGMSAVQITIHFTVNVLAVKVTTIL